jgi:hypothetical protein
MLRPARKAVRAFVGFLLEVVHGKATPRVLHSHRVDEEDRSAGQRGVRLGPV